MGQGIDDVVHPHTRVRGVFRIGILINQLPKALVRFARSALVAFSQTLAGQLAEQAELIIEVDQAPQIKRVVVGPSRVPDDSASTFSKPLIARSKAPLLKSSLASAYNRFGSLGLMRLSAEPHAANAIRAMTTMARRPQLPEFDMATSRLFGQPR
mgnify:CR=1 FL=1